jgi:hypothetical protein
MKGSLQSKVSTKLTGTDIGLTLKYRLQ